ncbi:MAG: coat protein/nuclear export [Cressdnaviricota sp.]|nr:MAG: coat protein/nuclear export [Cressdnaviricota sp.]
MSGYEKRRAAFRASKGKYSGSKRAAAVSSRRTVEEIKRIAYSTAETKHEGTTFTNDLDVPTLQLLNGVAQGDTGTTRDGNRITMSSIEIRGNAYPGISTDDINRGVLVIVLDRQPNGLAPNLGEIYDVSSGTIDPVIALRNDRFLERYKILYREDFVLGFKANTGGGGTWYPPGEKAVHMIHKYIDLTKVLKEKDRLVRYSASTTNVSGIQTNSIYALTFPSNQSDLSSGTDFAKINCNVKLNFKDL